MSNLTVAPSPHIHSTRTTSRIMLDVIIALLPDVAASFYYFGVRSLVLVAFGVGFSVLCEYIFNIICKKDPTVYDLSAAVTGLILALNVPSTLPLWQLAVGCAFAIIAVKGLFGGIGQNFANPAATARVMMVLSFSTAMGATVLPHSADLFASATPLTLIKSGILHQLPDKIDLFLGNCGGALGETCSLALILGGIYLLARKVITWHAPVAFIGTIFLFSLVLGRDPVVEILCGGVMLAAFFMITDYSSTPINRAGRFVFGIGCGVITMLIRVWGNYPEGVSFAILLMNILTPYVEKWTAPKPLGGVKNEK